MPESFTKAMKNARIQQFRSAASPLLCYKLEVAGVAAFYGVDHEGHTSPRVRVT